MQERIKIVLCHTTHPGNIGATARAMKTMGLDKLRLVAPRDYPSAEATARAAGADDLLAHCELYATLEQAVADCNVVVATTARVRSIRWPEYPADAAAKIIVEKVQLQQSVAMVFGQERAGLSNEQLDLCHFMIRIPTNPDFSSLNIAAAVQIICYELNKQLSKNSVLVDDKKPVHIPATAENMERFYQQFEELLISLSYLDRTNPGMLMRRIRRLFNRSELDNDEYNIFMGIVTTMKKRVD